MDTASDERFSGTAVWVMRSPEVSPSSLDVVIAPVICWQKRGTEKIWRLGKTSTPPQCRRSSVGRAPRQEVCRWFEPNRLHHRRDLLPRSRTERKPAKVVFPVRCTKAAGRSNLCIGWHRLCKDERMRPTYRRRAEKFRGWFGCRRVRRKSEAKPVDVEAAWWRLSLDKAAV